MPQIINPLDSLWNYLSNKYLYVKIWFRMKELCLFYSSTALCLDFNSTRVAFNNLHIAPCRNLQIEWFLLRWKEHFMGFRNIRKYSVFAFWGRATYWWHLQLPIFSSPMLTIFNLLDLGLCENCLSPPLLILKLHRLDSCLQFLLHSVHLPFNLKPNQTFANSDDVFISC